jgi:hypothetical protein
MFEKVQGIGKSFLCLPGTVSPESNAVGKLGDAKPRFPGLSGAIYSRQVTHGSRRQPTGD